VKIPKSALALAGAAAAALLIAASPPSGGLRFTVTYGANANETPGPFDGRLLVMLSKDPSDEPRNQIRESLLSSQQVFGVDVEGWKARVPAAVEGDVLGFPVENLAQIPPGTYTVQALLHRYETLRRADGHVVRLPMDRGEGQQWSKAPGNLYSTPKQITIEAGKREPATIAIELDRVIPPIPEPATTKYVKHERIRSEKLSKFWGRDMYLGAHVLLPEGFDEHPEARYPLVIYHGHHPATIEGWRETPPDPDLKPKRSERFGIDDYNRIEQDHAYQLYKDWTGVNYPRYILVEIQHANPYYDDSYAVNSQNLGPYGDAITYELIPYLEKKYRAIGAGWARFLYGGSTGGWEALGVQVLYPDQYNGCWAACPDPIDFRQYTVVNIYENENAYRWKGPWGEIETPGHRDYLGHVNTTIEASNRMELVLGTKGRSGGQWDIWEAVFSPVGADGYPQRIWDKRTGVIDRKVAAFWKENYDLVDIMRRNWQKGLGAKLAGKIHIYVGEADNYYLNNAVYLADDFLRSTTNPPYGGEIDYEPRAEHCWNGDHTRPNAIARLRYHQFFAPKIVDRILKSAPPGGDVTSWRY
jgi:hypothetical protein